jgi:hypothetical protein
MAEDINISPDMINNLVNMLKNGSSSNNAGNNDNLNNNNSATQNNIESNTSNNINFEDILSKLSSSSSNDYSQNTSSIDFETIMKIKSIMEALNTKNDPKSNLLYSLKPYLRKSKQDKLDQYVNILKISQVANLFKTEKGDTQ